MSAHAAPASVPATPLRRVPEYKVWKTMISRCHNEADASFKRYGARGIVVCDRWRASFADFYADMGPRPAGRTSAGRSTYSIERVDNDGAYEPSNCVWATLAEQAANRRIARHLIAGQQLTLKEARRISGVTRQALRARMRKGLSLEQAVLAKRDPRGRPNKAG